MPELPDVETFRRYLNSTALHQDIVGVEVLDERILDGVSPARLQRALKGSAFEQTHRHGKYLFVQVDEAGWLVLHFGMTGYLEYGKDRDAGEHDRVIFRFSQGRSLAYVCQRLLGKVTLTETVDAFVESADLGPDAMEIDENEFRSRIQGAGVKSGLMNQKHIAGIGNIYSDEVLFQAHVRPDVRAGHLDEKRLSRLYKTMRRVLEMATERQADPDRMPRTWLLPNREPGRPCPRCRTEIRKDKMAGRSAFWCPDCQKA
mgnify:FL=1